MPAAMPAAAAPTTLPAAAPTPPDMDARVTVAVIVGLISWVVGVGRRVVRIVVILRLSRCRRRDKRGGYHGAPKPAGLFRLCCRRSDKFIRSHFVLHQDCSGPSHRRRHLK